MTTLTGTNATHQLGFPGMPLMFTQSFLRQWAIVRSNRRARKHESFCSWRNIPWLLKNSLFVPKSEN